jgi:antitoxin (DNA-binding transcriptional repressor) of toxin-antitoxin stability system
MATRIIKIEDVPQDLAALIRRMHERGEYVVITDHDGPVAYLNLAFRPDLRGRAPGAPADALPEPGKPQVSFGKLTSVPGVNARWGQRMVTAEEIYEELRGAFP